MTAGALALAQLLVRHGAPPCAAMTPVSSGFKDTPVHYAALQQDLPMLEVLLGLPPSCQAAVEPAAATATASSDKKRDKKAKGQGAPEPAAAAAQLPGDSADMQAAAAALAGHPIDLDKLDRVGWRRSLGLHLSEIWHASGRGMVAGPARRHATTILSS